MNGQLNVWVDKGEGEKKRAIEKGREEGKDRQKEEKMKNLNSQIGKNLAYTILSQGENCFPWWKIENF